MDDLYQTKQNQSNYYTAASTVTNAFSYDWNNINTGMNNGGAGAAAAAVMVSVVHVLICIMKCTWLEGLLSITTRGKQDKLKKKKV